MISIIKFLNSLFVEECLNCGKSGNLICEVCLENIQKSKLKYLNKVPDLSYSERIDYKNTEYLQNITWISSSLPFQNNAVKKSLYSLKYNYVKDIAKYLAKVSFEDFYNFLNKNIRELNQNTEKIIIIPIPISKKRLIKRNYNQSEILLNEIIINIYENYNLNLSSQVYTDLIIKNKHTIPFHQSLNQESRLKLIQNVFTINPKYNSEFLKGKIIILFDDITTTGATFYELRKTLINYGLNQESILAFALAH